MEADPTCSWVSSHSALFYRARGGLSSTDNPLLNYTSLSFTNSSPNGEGTVTILFHCGPLMDEAARCLHHGRPLKASVQPPAGEVKESHHSSTSWL